MCLRSKVERPKFRCFRIVERGGGGWWAGVILFIYYTYLYLLHHTATDIYRGSVCGDLTMDIYFYCTDYSGNAGQLFF